MPCQPSNNLEDNRGEKYCQVAGGRPQGSPATLLEYINSISEPKIRFCRYGYYKWLNITTGEIKEFNCHSWSCPVCSEKMAYELAIDIAFGQPERLMTLTNVPEGREDAQKAWRRFCREVRKRYEFEFVRLACVGEANGMIHFHILQKGDFIPVRELSKVAVKCGFGKIVDIREIYSGIGLVKHLTNYVTREPAPVGWHKVSWSRGYPRNVVEKDPSDDWILVRGEKDE